MTAGPAVKKKRLKLRTTLLFTMAAGLTVPAVEVESAQFQLVSSLENMPTPIEYLNRHHISYSPEVMREIEQLGTNVRVIEVGSQQHRAFCTRAQTCSEEDMYSSGYFQPVRSLLKGRYGVIFVPAAASSYQHNDPSNSQGFRLEDLRFAWTFFHELGHFKDIHYGRYVTIADPEMPEDERMEYVADTFSARLLQQEFGRIGYNFQLQNRALNIQDFQHDRWHEEQTIPNIAQRPSNEERQQALHIINDFADACFARVGRTFPRVSMGYETAYDYCFRTSAPFSNNLAERKRQEFLVAYRYFYRQNPLLIQNPSPETATVS